MTYDSHDLTDCTVDPPRMHVHLSSSDVALMNYEGSDVPIVNSETGGKTHISTTDTVLTAVENQSTYYLAVKLVGPATVVSGSFTEANLNVHPFSAVSAPCGAAITVVADAANDVAGVLIGGAAPAYPLYAGKSVTVAVNDLANVYYQFQHAGDKIYYIQSE